MTEAMTSPNKYVYLDIVGFTRGRSVEAQSALVHVLNELVRQSVTAIQIPDERIIFLPTGDGLCIVIMNIEAEPEFPSAYDVHLRLALDILNRVHKHNAGTDGEQLRFQMRVGVNENTDNLVTDINGRPNVAGDGINTAQRVMGLADGGQILVTDTVYARLRVRERYMNSTFRNLPPAQIKHNLVIRAYQFIKEGHAGLDTETPTRYVTPKDEKQEPKLTKFAAYYFAHAIKNRTFLIANKDYHYGFADCALLYFLATDSVVMSEASETRQILLSTYKAREATLEEQLQYYYSLGPSISSALLTLTKLLLENFLEYCDDTLFCRFVTPSGAAKLKAEWPDIWAEFNLDSANARTPPDAA